MYKKHFRISLVLYCHGIRAKTLKSIHLVFGSLFGFSILFFLDLISWFLFLVKSCLWNDLNIFLFDLLERTILLGLSNFSFLSRERNYGVILLGQILHLTVRRRRRNMWNKRWRMLKLCLGSLEVWNTPCF
jgi:hypothetical protein